jgi:hypothetical protein
LDLRKRHTIITGITITVMAAAGSYWNYYRTDWPGRGNNEESTR